LTYYIKRGNIHQIVDEANLQVTKRLPNGTYSISQNPETGEFYFVEVNPFDIRGKIYGNTKERAKRILNTFSDRPSGTGVLLAGEKGSGKTLLAKMLSVEGLALDYVSIIINAPWHGENFNKFIQQVEQPAIILFDELSGRTPS
jgi:SpoVK/Ycf46/Vps4 family AAA+-type ATPase